MVPLQTVVGKARFGPGRAFDPNYTSIVELLLILANQHFHEFGRGTLTATCGALPGPVGAVTEFFIGFGGCVQCLRRIVGDWIVGNGTYIASCCQRGEAILQRSRRSTGDDWRHDGALVAAAQQSFVSGVGR